MAASCCKLLCLSLITAAHAATAASGAAVDIAVYWGQNANEGSLAATCSTGRYTLVTMAFLSRFGNGQTPALNLAGHCDPSGGGCYRLRGDINSCQSNGVKVLLSIGGGAVGGYGLASASDARSVASYLWDAFLGGTAASVSRPFGDAVLDGIDLDVASNSSHYDDLARSLASLYRGDKGGRRYLLTAAPQCPYPDASLGPALATGLFDHVWVQFFNNPGCQYQSDLENLRSAWDTWAQAFPSASLFLGLPASPDAASGGYIAPQVLLSQVLPAVNRSANYGGIMLWDRYYDANSGYSVQLLGKANPPTGSLIPGRSGNAPLAGLPLSPPTIERPQLSIIDIAAGLFVLCMILLAIFLCCKKCYGMMPWHRESRNVPRLESFLQRQETAHPQRYTYSQVKRMTKSFAHVLGRGGYGSVFRGNLPGGREIAVKVLKDTEGDGEEFMNEVASISRTSHVNVVNLLGFCLQGSKRALIYEYMPNGSLDRHVLGNNSTEGDQNLSWDRLFDIVVGIARGLEYLHNGCNTPIVHFDIKPQNILLDQDFCPKISDFGLAKLCRQKQSKISIAGTRGTIGYIAPEVFNRSYGAVSNKSDVYGFGMVVLEMVGARKQIDVSTDSSSKYFPQWLYENLDQFCGATTCEISSGTTDLVRKMTIVGLWCIQFRPIDRPSISKVIEMLESNTEDLLLPPKASLTG